MKTTRKVFACEYSVEILLSVLKFVFVKTKCEVFD